MRKNPNPQNLGIGDPIHHPTLGNGHLHSLDPHAPNIGYARFPTKRGLIMCELSQLRKRS